MPTLRRPHPDASIQVLFLIFGVAIAVFFPFFSAFLDDRGLTESQIGLVVATMALARVVGNPLWGHLADTSLGRKPVLMLGTVLSGTAAVSIVLAGESFPLIVVASFVFAGMGGALGPNTDAIAIANLGDDRMHLYGRIRGWESFTYALACVGAGYVFDRAGVGWSLPLYASCCLAMFLWATTLTVPRIRHVGEHGRLGAAGTVIRDNPRFLAFLGATLLLWFGFSAAWNFIGLRIIDGGGGPLLIGLGAGFGGLVEVPMMRSSSELSERFGLRALFVAGCLVYAFGFLVWALVTDPILLSALTFLEGIGFALVFTTSVVIVGKLVPPTLYSSGQAVSSMVGFGMAPILGGLVGGLVYESFGSTSLYLGAAGVAVIAAAVAHRALDSPELVRRQPIVESGAPPLGDLGPEQPL